MVFTLEFGVSKVSLMFRVTRNSYVIIPNLRAARKSREMSLHVTYNYAAKPDLQAVLLRGVILNLSEPFYWMTTFARALTCQILLIVFNMFIIGSIFFH